MARSLLSKKSAHIISFLLFAAGIAVLAYFKIWWPALILVLGIPIALKHYLLGEFFDTYLSLFIFFGVFATFQFQIKFDILLPVFFTIGGIYIFFKEFFGKGKSKSSKHLHPEGEDEEDFNEEDEEFEDEKDSEDKE